MYTIEFYKDSRGREPVYEYLDELSKKNDKNSRINYNKAIKYIQKLCDDGTKAGMPFIRHLDGAIWELRPINERILFVAWINGSFLLLHHFTKKTQTTPVQEIETAKNRLNDYIERSKQNDRRIY
ncbi:MAG: type II toxin-antitoxin system RelE/ParE family toxin [Oscillospiraceae bacterium]|nr:type II toxin-antitoxin system RelE/ParE family toxin [Oscillospiraceae bacterium]